MKTVGAILREARVERKLTLRQVDAMSQHRFLPSTLACYERAERSIPLMRFCELSRIYAIPADRLLAHVFERLEPDVRGEHVVGVGVGVDELAWVRGKLAGELPNEALLPTADDSVRPSY